MDDTSIKHANEAKDAERPRASRMRILEEVLVPRKNRGKGITKEPKVYDGTGPSGYSGTSGSPRRIRQVQCVQLPLKEVPRDLLRPGGGKKSRRKRRTQWVSLEALRKYA